MILFLSIYLYYFSLNICSHNSLFLIGISEAIFIDDIYFCNFFEWLSIFLDFIYYKNSKIFGVDFVLLYKVFNISSLKFVLLFYVRKVFDI